MNIDQHLATLTADDINRLASLVGVFPRENQLIRWLDGIVKSEQARRAAADAGHPVEVVYPIELPVEQWSLRELAAAMPRVVQILNLFSNELSPPARQLIGHAATLVATMLEAAITNMEARDATS